MSDDGFSVGSRTELNSTNETGEGEQLILNSKNGKCAKLVKSEETWTVLLLLAAAAATFGSCVPVGYNIGVINAPAQIIKEFCNQTIVNSYHKVLSPIALDTFWTCIVSTFIIGGIIGSLTGSASANKWGRKGSIAITHFLGLVAGMCFILSKEIPSVEVLIMGRFLIGVSSGLSTAIVPMYLTELAPLKLRGAAGVMCPLGLTIGVILAQALGLDCVLGKKDTWHYLLSIYSFLVLAALAILPQLPESPKYLAAIKRQENLAIKELLRIRGCREEYLVEELDQLRNEIATDRQRSTWTSWKVLKEPELSLPLFLVCALQAGQQLSGINAVFYYSITIFESAGLTCTQAEYANLGAGAVNLLAGIISIFIMNIFGRKPLLLISCVGSILCMCLLVLSIALFTLNSWISYVSVAAVLLYVLIYGLGLGPIPYFIGTELFEVGPRSIAMGWGSMFNWGANFIVAMLFPFLQCLIGEFSFLIFIIITLALAVLVIFYFPETKDRDQSEISALLKHGFKSNIKIKSKVEENAFEKENSPLASSENESS